MPKYVIACALEFSVKASLQLDGVRGSVSDLTTGSKPARSGTDAQTGAPPFASNSAHAFALVQEKIELSLFLRG